MNKIILVLFLLFALGCDDQITSPPKDNTISGIVIDYKIAQTSEGSVRLFVEFSDGRIIALRLGARTPLAMQKEHFNIFSIDPNYEVYSVEIKDQ